MSESSCSHPSGTRITPTWWAFHVQSVLFLWMMSLVVLVHPQQLRYNKELSKHVTNLLDGLLKEDRYDKRIRPNFGGNEIHKL